ncbi:MAG: hypothetical protein ABIO49_00350 [Dokdonella sp.]
MISCREAASPRPFLSPRTFAHVLLLAATLAIASVALADTTFNVNTAADQIDQDVSDGLCQTSNGTCSLRAAIMQANHLSGPGTAHILLSAGTYTLTRPATESGGEDNGDLNFTTPLAEVDTTLHEVEGDRFDLFDEFMEQG